jgi:uncharacterized protein
MEENMSAKHSRKIFVNLPVRDLTKSMAFFATLGFEFNRQFTDEKAACMVISDEGFVMLLSEPFFRTFTKRQLCDTTTHTEGLFAVSCNSRAEVDDLVKKAIAAGGTHAMDLRITASCMAGASTTSTGITGRSSGWTPRRSRRAEHSVFNSLDTRNRYAILFRIHTAKKVETPAKRIQQFVAILARNEKLYLQ